MATRERLSDGAVEAFVAGHAGWARAGDALERAYSFAEYGAGVGFAVRVAMAAERRDHHPELVIAWGEVRVRWSTHDSGGITGLDVEMAERCDQLYGA